MLYFKLSAVLLFGTIAPLGWAAEHNPLLPRPQKISYGEGRLAVRALGIRFGSAPGPEDRFGARELARRLKTLTGMEAPIGETTGASPAIVLTRSDAVDHPLAMLDEQPGPDSREAYHLRVTPKGVEILGRSSAAVFYGIQTLCQLVEGKGEEALLPEVEIEDWPSLAYRQTVWDMSQGGRSTEAEVERQIDFMARWKGNQYGFFTENNIELDGYPGREPGKRFSKDEVRRIVAYARERHIDVIPWLELYGHQHDLFKMERYSDLADYPHGWEFNPSDPKVQSLLTDWAEQFTQLFPSPLYHIGFDETWMIKRAAPLAGAGVTPEKLFLGQVNFVANLFERRGKRAMVAGDMLAHLPGIAEHFPRDIIVSVWWYDASPDPEYKKWMKPVVEHGLPYFVMTMVGNSYYRVAPDFRVGFENIDTFLAVGRNNKALGLINSLWGDGGRGLLRQCWPGVAYGEIASWQTSPVDHAHFFSEYARQMYGARIASQVAPGLEKLSQSELALQKAFGGQTLAALWDNPFDADRLKTAGEHREDLRQVRILAEDAEEHLDRALAWGGDGVTLDSLLFGSRMLDYAGMKYLYALQISEQWERIRQEKQLSPVQFGFAPLEIVIARHLFRGDNHGLVGDLVDTIPELRSEFQRNWLAEYSPYRLGNALGQFDLEYGYWRHVQERFEEFHNGHKKPGERWPALPWPPLDTIVKTP